MLGGQDLPDIRRFRFGQSLGSCLSSLVHVVFWQLDIGQVCLTGKKVPWEPLVHDFLDFAFDLKGSSTNSCLVAI